jgi:hypothetical protein
MEGDNVEDRVSDVIEVYGLALPSIESSVYNSSKFSYSEKKKVDSADNMLNVVAPKVQF